MIDESMDIADLIDKEEDLAPPLRVPGTSIIKDETRITDVTTGEVLGGEELALLLGMNETQAQQFQIRDRETAEWYVGRIVGLQKEIETFAAMSKKMIANAMNHMKRLEAQYNGQLRTYCEAELQSNRTMSGKLRRKYVPFMRGGVYFRKSGGVKLGDRVAVQEWVDGIDASLMEKLGVRLMRKWNVADLRKAVQAKMHIPGFDVAPEHELGIMRIGAERPWTPTKVKNMLSDITTALPATADEEEESDE